jgi:hypothetical protein
MDIFISTTEDKEKEVKTAFATSIQNLSGYVLPETDIRVEFVCDTEDFIKVNIAVPGTREAFSLVNYLTNNRSYFLQMLSEDISEELFKYLLFNNRISYMAFYLKLYKKVKLNIIEEVFGRQYQHEFVINK